MPSRRPSAISAPIIMAVGLGCWSIAAASAASADPAGLAAPYGPAVNGPIVYGTDGDIWIADAGGVDPRVLIGGPETDAWPIFSRDGAHLMFERREAGPDSPPRLMVAASDGTDPVAFTGIPGDFPWSDWSPDGVHYAVQWMLDDGWALQVLTTDASEPTRTIDLGDVEIIDLAGFRPPDGQEIVFSGHPQGSEEAALYAIGLDGAGLRAIGDSKADGFFGDMAMSPDGSLVAYWSWEPNAAGELGGYQHLRDLTTGEDRRVSLDPVWPEVGALARFTPDGRSLVFESGPHPDAPGVNSQLVVAPLDGSAPARTLGVAYSNDDRESHDISPDGTTVIQDLAGATWFIDIATGGVTESAVYMPDQPSWQRR